MTEDRTPEKESDLSKGTGSPEQQSPAALNEPAASSENVEDDSGGFMEVLMVLALLLIPVWGVADLLGLLAPPESEIHQSAAPVAAVKGGSGPVKQVAKALDLFMGDFALSVQSYSRQEITAVTITIDGKYSVTTDSEEVLPAGGSISIPYTRIMDLMQSQFSMERHTPKMATVKFMEGGTARTLTFRLN